MMAEDLDEVFLVSQTEHVSHSFNCIPASHVREKWDPSFVQKLLKRQEKMVSKKKLESQKLWNIKKYHLMNNVLAIPCV